METWGGTSGRRPWRVVVATLAAATLLLSAGCGGAGPSWHGGTGPSGAGSPTPKPSTVAVTEPAANATGVGAITAVKYTSEDPDHTSVVVKDSSSRRWVPILPQPGTVRVTSPPVGRAYSRRGLGPTAPADEFGDEALTQVPR